MRPWASLGPAVPASAAAAGSARPSATWHLSGAVETSRPPSELILQVQRHEHIWTGRARALQDLRP